jgi:hypothetical protein
MKTILSGPVRKRHLEDAEFLMGIVPTSFLTNGETTPPVTQLPTEVNPPCPMLPGELGEHQRNYTLCLSADALICVGANEHLVGVARKYGLPVYEVAR